MMNNSKKLVLSVLAAAILYQLPVFIGADGAGQVQAAEQKQTKKQRASKKVSAMRNRVYSQLARAQKIADEGDKAGGLAVLDEVQQRLDSMNSYEQAMLWNFYGFMHYANEDMAQAIANFEKVVAIEAIPDTLYLSTLYSLGQLAMQQADYGKALKYLTQWRQDNTKEINADQEVLFAQVYYQDKNYSKTLAHITKAITLAKAANKTPKENWLILQRAAYYELKQPLKVTEVMEQLVRYYDKPEYWVQLGGMYGEIGQEKKQLGVMEAAWQAGYLEKPAELQMLAQLYLYHQLPYKAASVLDDAIADGKVVADVKRLALLAQAYMLAKEDDKAIPVLVKAAQIAENGKFDAQLAQAYLNLENWPLAIAAADKALERGGIDNLGNMHLVLGMAHFNLKQFEQALVAFTNAQELPKVKKTAKQWHTYVSKEAGYQQKLAMLNAGK